MEIYIVRHGETIWNEKKLLQGRTDIELNENGRRLAIITGKNLRNTHFDIVFSSPLKRAHETACLIVGDRNIPIVTNDLIKEMCFGDWEGQNMSELLKDPSQDFQYFFKHPELYHPIVAHGAINKAMMMHVKKHDLKDFWSGGLQQNCNVIIMDYSDGIYRIIDETKIFY